MSNEQFKVKFGLAVGDTQATIDGTNGDISTLGDIDVKGGGITNSTGALSITTASNGDITLDPNGTGQVVVNADVDVNGTIYLDQLQVDNININGNTIATTDTNGNLLLSPNGTGQVHSVATSTQIGTGAANAQITTSGAYDMTLSTNNGSNSGTIVITNGANGDIAIDTDNTGEINLNAPVNITGLTSIGSTLTTTGTNNLILNTNNGTNSGSIQITQGPSGNIAIDTDNTGEINLNAPVNITGLTSIASTLTTTGTNNLILNTNNGTNSGSIQITQGPNGDITVDTNGTGEIDLNAPVNITGLTSIAGTLTTTGANNLILNTNNGTNSGVIQITQGTNGNIEITPNGSGVIQVGASNTTATITTNGTGDLLLNTNLGTNAGSITLADGANGNITMDPDGTGNIVVTLANGGNLTNSRNYVFGAVRNATTLAAGDIWALNAATATQPFRGITVDNSADTTKNAGYVARNYSATAGNRSRLVFERARGTAASPTAVQSGDTIASIDVTGCNANGVFISDGLQGTATATSLPGLLSFTAAETWSAGTGTGPIYGTTFVVTLAPSATAIASAATLVPIITANPQTFACRSDAYTWSNGKTGSTQRMSLDVSGNLIVSGDVRINGNDIQGSGGSTAITLTSANTSTTVVGDTFKVNSAGGINYFQTFNDGSGHIVASVNQTRATTGNEFAAVNFTTQRSADGINFTPTLNNDVIGSFKFNGNANTSTSPGVPAGPGAQIFAQATENWTASVNGTKINFNVIKKGTITDVDVISAASDATTFKSDTYTFADNAGTNVTGNKITYNRVYGQFQYDTTVTPVAADTAYVFPLGTADINNIATVGSTSRLIAGAAGIYNLQFSVQVDNVDNSNDHDAYIWLRKNGTDVVGSMGRTTVPKNNAGSLQIIAWNYIVSSANTTDYWEIAYAVSDTDVTFPAFAATAFGPSTATIIISLVPVGV